MCNGAVADTDISYKADLKAEDLPVKCVALRFEGKEALKSIDIMIEDLQKIRENLSKDCEVESEHI